jgi:hypothetical protein
MLIFLLNANPKVNEVTVSGRLSIGWLKLEPKVTEVTVFGLPKTDRKIVYSLINLVTKG